MAGQAQITSVEAIESFRAKLIVFLTQTRPVLDEAASEVSRTRLWLQNEQREFWEHELRVRAPAAGGGQTGIVQRPAFPVSRFHRPATHGRATAKRAVQEAEEQMLALKKWDRELENRAAPLMKQTEQLQGFLATDMARAVAYLDQALKALEAYRSVASPAPKNPPSSNRQKPGRLNEHERQQRPAGRIDAGHFARMGRDQKLLARREERGV